MSDIKPPRCHWDGEQRVTERHLRDCNSAGCEGCAPCREDHCRCGGHLHENEPLTCAKCVGKVRTNLGRIHDLCRLAPVAATEGGVTSATAVLAGPVPEHSTHAARRAWAYGGGLCRCLDCPDHLATPEGPVCEDATTCLHHVCRRRTWRPTCPGLSDWLEYADDEQHPLWVLGTWDMLVAEHLDHDRRSKVTVAGAASYLKANLTDLAQDQDFAFDELDREVRTCLDHVERVMGVAAYFQRGAPCPECRAQGRKARALELRHRGGGNDVWRCPSKVCAKTYDLGQYGEYVYREYLGNADKLTAEQILAQYRVAPSTVRRWASGWTDRGVWNEPTVRRRGKDREGRQLYDVADVKQMRDKRAA